MIDASYTRISMFLQNCWAQKAHWDGTVEKPYACKKQRRWLKSWAARSEFDYFSDGFPPCIILCMSKQIAVTGGGVVGGANV